MNALIKELIESHVDPRYLEEFVEDVEIQIMENFNAEVYRFQQRLEKKAATKSLRGSRWTSHDSTASPSRDGYDDVWYHITIDFPSVVTGKISTMITMDKVLKGIRVIPAAALRDLAKSQKLLAHFNRRFGKWVAREFNRESSVLHTATMETAEEFVYQNLNTTVDSTDEDEVEIGYSPEYEARISGGYTLSYKDFKVVANFDLRVQMEVYWPNDTRYRGHFG